MSYRVIRASEIGDYVFCRRAWWLRRTAGRQPRNADQLATGVQHHRAHGATVRRAEWLRRAALALIFLAVSILVFWLVGVL